MTPTTVSEPTPLDPTAVYEACPVCSGDDEQCAWCDGEGLVEHECDDDCEGDE
jgi:hypothetical protein